VGTDRTLGQGSNRTARLANSFRLIRLSDLKPASPRDDAESGLCRSGDGSVHRGEDVFFADELEDPGFGEVLGHRALESG
jgi:hypothetical protein